MDASPRHQERSVQLGASSGVNTPHNSNRPGKVAPRHCARVLQMESKVMDSNWWVRRRWPMRNPNSNRSYLLHRRSKCNEIFTAACVQGKECSCQVSARLDHFLMDSKSLRIDHRSSRNLVGSVAWAHSRARKSLPKFEQDEPPTPINSTLKPTEKGSFGN
jgi:hypothetical protein